MDKKDIKSIMKHNIKHSSSFKKYLKDTIIDIIYQVINAKSEIEELKRRVTKLEKKIEILEKEQRGIILDYLDFKEEVRKGENNGQDI